MRQDLVDETVGERFFRVEVEVAVDILCDLLDSFARAFREDFVERLAILQDFVRLDLDIGDLTADSAPRLMDHDFAVRQSVALAFRSPREKNRAAACGQSDAIGGDGTREEFHRVVDRQHGRNASAGRVNIKVNFLSAINALQIEELHHQIVRRQVVDLSLQEDDAVVVDAGRGEMIEQVATLVEASHIVFVELSVLGLARAQMHIEWLEQVGLNSVEQRNTPPGIGQEVRPMAAVPGRIVAVVGVEPRGTVRERGMVTPDEATSYLGRDVIGTLRADGHLCGDVLEGLGVRAVPRRNRPVIDELTSIAEHACALDGRRD